MPQPFQSTGLDFNHLISLTMFRYHTSGWKSHYHKWVWISNITLFFPISSVFHHPWRLRSRFLRQVTTVQNTSTLVFLFFSFWRLRVMSNSNSFCSLPLHLFHLRCYYLQLLVNPLGFSFNGFSLIYNTLESTS